MLSVGASWQRFLLPLILLILGVVVAARLQLGSWSPSHFIVHGEVFHHPESNTSGVVPVAEGGYDGQFFTRLAFNPLDVRKDAHGISLDKPAYRAQRMLFPVLGWTVAFGDPRIVPYALIAINILALTALFVLVSRLLAFVAPGADRLYLLLAVLLPGFLFSLSRNLSEPLGVCFAASALVMLMKRRMAAAAVAFALATLVRETFCLTAFASGLWLFFIEGKEQPLKTRLQNTLLVWSSIVPMLIWQGYLYTQLGTIGPLDSPGNMAAPLTGFVTQLLTWAGSPNGKAVANAGYLFWHVLLAAFVVFLFLRSRKSPGNLSADQKLLGINWLVISLFMTLLSTFVWEDAWAFCRVLAEWSVLSILIVASFRPRLPLWLAGYSFALTGLSLVRIVTRL